MKTIVRIDFFKQSGKWYTDLNYESEIPVGDVNALKIEAEQKAYIKDMNYTLDIKCMTTQAWNRYLIIRS